MPTPMTQTSTLELLGPDVAEDWFLSSFCTWAQQHPEFSAAPIRHVMCNRSGVHEFILLGCELPATSVRPASTVWMRIERRPSQGAMAALLSKSRPAVDTVQISTSPDKLRGPCGARDIFIYNPTDRPAQVLRLRDVAEMYQYFIRHSARYSVLGANCRWLCYALLECLRACKQCYGGNWMPVSAQSERPTADVEAALEVKKYLLQGEALDLLRE